MAFLDIAGCVSGLRIAFDHLRQGSLGPRANSDCASPWFLAHDSATVTFEARVLRRGA